MGQESDKKLTKSSTRGAAKKYFVICISRNQGFLSRTLKEGREPSFYPTLPLSPAHEHSDIYLQLCMWDDNHIFLIARLVFTRLLLDEIYHLDYRVTIWLIDDVTLVFVCLRNDSILAFILQQLETGNRWTRTRIDYHSCITTEPTNQVCISCGSDNITKRTNKNTSRRLSVPLRHLYNQLQGMIIPPLCQDGLLIHVWQCVKMAALIDPKTAISEFSRFFWYNVICLSNHLYEKKLLLFPSTVCHLLVNDIVERDLEKKWPSGYYNKERNPYDFFVFTY